MNDKELADLPTNALSRITIAYRRQGCPVFLRDPVTGDPVTVVLHWPTDTAGALLGDVRNMIPPCRRWRIDRATWTRLETLNRCGFEPSETDLLLIPTAHGLRPIPTWHSLATVAGLDVDAIAQPAIADLLDMLAVRAIR